MRTTTRLWTSLALSLLVSSACAHTALQPTPTPAPTPRPVYAVEGNNGELCVPQAHFYPAWSVVIRDAGPGLQLRGLVRILPEATCEGPWSGAGLVIPLQAYGRATYGPGEAGTVSFILKQHHCGRAQYEIWDDLTTTRIAVTRVNTGIACGG